MHTVTLSPASINLTPGGAPVVQTVTIGNVSDDTTVVSPVEVSVGSVSVSVNTTISIDHPSPTVSVTSAAPGSYSVTAATPVQTGPGEWVVELTYAPV